jgi:peptidase M23-like protein
MIRAAAAAALALTLGLLAGAPAAHARIGVAFPVDIATPLPPAPVRGDKVDHLTYELHLTNMSRSDMSIEQLEVLDGATRRRLALYDAKALDDMFSRPGASEEAAKAPRVIQGGLQAVMFLDIVAPAGRPAPASLVHVLKLTSKSPNATPGGSTIEVSVPVSRKPPIVLGPPLRGDGWVAANGLSNTSSHRRTLIPIDGHARIAQRYAIDFVRVGPDGKAWHGDRTRNASWVDHGADLIAVADGRVIEISDTLKENEPVDERAVKITVDTIAGNYLLLDLGQGRYGLYAHVRPGSFRVKAGQMVKRGQVLASLGNTGNSDAPHLHFHVVDQPSPLGGEGVPFVFDRFTLQGYVPSLDFLDTGDAWVAATPARPDVRVNELPTENAVVAFR